MNRQILFKLIAMLVSVYINNAQAASLSVDMVPGPGIDSSRIVSLGSAFDVDILINDVTDFAGFEFDLGFDPLILAASSIDSGNIFGADTFPLSGLINADSISFAETTLALPPGLDISVPTLLATIHFNAIGSGTSNLDLRNTILSDSAGEPITPITENDGQLTAQAPVTTAPEPSSVLLLCLGLLSLISIKRKTKVFSVTA
jgi:hypothetical protein